MSQRGPHVSDIEQRRGLISEELIDDEVVGDEVGTNMFPILFRTYGYPWFARRVIRASLPASMVAACGGAPAIPGGGMARRPRLRHL